MPVSMVCDAFDVSRSSYYDYRQRRQNIDANRLSLRAMVRRVFTQSRGSAGSRTIKVLLNQAGIAIGRFKVRRLMRELGLTSRQPGPYAYRTATVEKPDIPNVLGFVSRKGKLVYHTTTESVTTETVIEAFDQFVAQKDPDVFAIVVLDNASMHRSKALNRKILEWRSYRVHLVYLSAYSPELNLIDILWRQVKYHWLPIDAYLSFDRLCDEVHRLLNGYGTERTINYE